MGAASFNFTWFRSAYKFIGEMALHAYVQLLHGENRMVQHKYLFSSNSRTVMYVIHLENVLGFKETL